MLGTYIVTGVCVCISIITGICMFWAKRNMKSLNSESWNNEDVIKRKAYRKLYTRTSAIFFLCVATTLVLLLNLLFVAFEKWNWTVVSLLSYTETLIMMVSLFSTVVIAFFQYQVQLQIEDEHWLVDENNRNWHYKELCSEKLKSLGALHTLRGYAVNFNLPEAYIYHNERGNSAYHIVVGDKNKTDQALFLQPYFRMAEPLQVVCEYKGERIRVCNQRISPNYLIIDLDDNDPRAKVFFVSACSMDEKIRNQTRLNVLVKLTVEDHSINPEINFNYSVAFCLVPAQTGYQKSGMFLLDLEQVSMDIGNYANRINENKR